MSDLITLLREHRRRTEPGFVEETGMLRSDDHELLYVMTLPEQPLSKLGVVISHSFFETYMFQRTELKLLRRLAAAGVPSIYVQAPGMGDSEGFPRECRCTHRVAAALSAFACLDQAIDGLDPCFFGARVGGLVSILAARQHGGRASLCVWDPVLDGSAYWKQVARLERIAATVGRKTGFVEPGRHLAERGRVTLLGVETTPDQLEDLKTSASSVHEGGSIRGDALAIALSDGSMPPLRAALEPMVEGHLATVALGLRDPWALGLRKGDDAIDPTVSWLAGEV